MQGDAAERLSLPAFLKRAAGFLLVIFLLDYGICAFLDVGLRRYFGLDKPAQVVCVGHSRTILGIDETLLAFDNAVKALNGNKKLQKDIQKEARYFVEDWMSHPVYEKIDNNSTALLLSQLNRMLEFGGDSQNEKNDVARTVHRIALKTEPDFPGTLHVVEGWIEQQQLHKPNFERITGGVRLFPESFIYAGYGPSAYGYECPSKNAVGIYVKGNSRQLSHRMVAAFDMESEAGGKEGIFQIEGQVSENHPLSVESGNIHSIK